MQATTGRDSAPRAISNAPISIFAEEKPRAAKKQAVPEVQALEVETPEVEPPTATASDPTVTTPDLATLVAQRKALDEQIKTAKASLPGQTKLDRMIQRQAARKCEYIWGTVCAQTVERMQCGQPRKEAFEAVLKVFADRAQTAIDQRLATVATDE